MNVTKTELPGVVVFEPRIFPDARGYLAETWSQRRYEEAGLSEPFVQDNLSSSKKGVLRGLHYQWPAAQGKLVTVLSGEVWDVAVDIRPESPTFRKWFGLTLSSSNHRQIYVPAGFAHGFVVTGDHAVVLYKCTEFYTPKDEGSLVWNDPDLAISWPVADPILADKDRNAPTLDATGADRLPTYPGRHA